LTNRRELAADDLSAPWNQVLTEITVPACGRTLNKHPIRFCVKERQDAVVDWPGATPSEQLGERDKPDVLALSAPTR